MTEKDWRIVFVLIVLFGIGSFGFFLGRKTVKVPKPKVVIEYVKASPIHDSIPYPVPYEVVEPIDTASVIKQCIRDGIYAELWPEKIVTEYIEITREDTTAVLKDWGTKRYYQETIFDSDTLGKFVLDAEVQYNRIGSLEYDFTPVAKTVTRTEYQVKAFSPFVGVGAMANPWDDEKDPTGVVSAGFFIKEKYGLQMNYQHGFNSGNDLLGGSILLKL